MTNYAQFTRGGWGGGVAKSNLRQALRRCISLAPVSSNLRQGFLVDVFHCIVSPLWRTCGRRIGSALGPREVNGD